MPFAKGNIPWHKGTKGLVTAWNKGKTLDEHHKKSLADANKKWRDGLTKDEKKSLPGLFKKGSIPWNKGQRGITTAWNKGMPWPMEFCERMSSIKKGKHNSGTFKKGHEPYYGNLGKSFSEEHRRKIGVAGIGRNVGAKNVNWKGGISKIDKIVRRMPEYIIWRDAVFERDKWKCVLCGKSGYITAHHINAFAFILQEHGIKTTDQARRCAELWDVKNGIALCEKCHSMTDNYKGKIKGGRRGK